MKFIKNNKILMNQWDFKKNFINPNLISETSKKKAYWLCKKGHSYFTNISSKLNGVGCPICSNKQVLKGYNDLQTLNPVLAKQWDLEKNNNLLPTQVVNGSGKAIWWKCEKNHSWQAKISDRKKNGCPYCANQLVLTGYNDLLTKNQELAKEWHPKNKLKANQVIPTSHKVYYWKCSKGHEWESKLIHRNNGYNKCPICFQKKNK
jgi:hypothetical protein